MDSIVSTAKTAFQSERLAYIKIDETNEDIKSFLPDVEDDPIVQALSSPAMLKPKGKKDIDWYAEQLAKSHLAVAICLRRDLTSSNGPSEENEKTNSPTIETSVQDKGTELAKPTIIGTVCLSWGGIDPSMLHHRNASVGITLGNAFQNKGYGREAINWIIDWGFRHAGLHTISIVTYSYNDRAAHLYRELGFQLEGRRRQVAWFDRKWYDELWFGITESEWEAMRSLN
ncbi:hypothetical protein QQS21_000597 [Conoideocrella luteorostrata]|uniref:N-acetyltransferase domain-containing protein n=1 Tax=Conoideocrella luteorostrata TaxID=1105319 RepID=A0AAJ0CYS3_9HYPO|nr:hypothetical protein QQS21_000597 [Conoideocrella luteorostrata]